MLKGVEARVNELGKIKIGKLGPERKSQNSGKTWRPPVKLDHFVITTLQRDEAGNLIEDTQLMQRLAAAQGVKPDAIRELPVAVLSDDIDEILIAQHCLYPGKTMAAKCDGVTCTWLQSQGKKLDKPVVVPCNGEHEKEGWKTHATFNCVIATGDARWGGVYKFRTTSAMSLGRLYGSLQQIQLLTGGLLQAIPLRLVVEEVTVAPEGTPTKVYIVRAEMRGDNLNQIQQQALQLAQMRLTNAKHLRAARSEYLKLLSAPGDDETEEEQASISAEFHAEDEPSGPVVEATKAATGATDLPPALLADPARTAPAPESPLDPVAALDEAAEVARAAPQDRQVEEWPAPVPGVGVTASAPTASGITVPPVLVPQVLPAAAADSPLDKALAVIRDAKATADLKPVFRFLSGLPDAEKKQAIAAYTAKQAELSRSHAHG